MLSHFIWLPFAIEELTSALKFLSDTPKDWSLQNDSVLACRLVEIVPDPTRVPRDPRVDTREPVGALVSEGDDADLEPAPPVEAAAVSGRAHHRHEGPARVALARVPRQGDVERAQLRVRDLDAAEVAEPPAALLVRQHLTRGMVENGTTMPYG